MPLNNNTDVNGNRDVIKLLETFTEHAKAEGLGYVAIVGARDPGSYVASYAGTTELEKFGLEGLKSIQNTITEHMLNRTVPDPDPRLDASYVCYNITQSPLSYDFTTWIIHRELNRIQKGAPGPLKVGFWYGRDGSTGIANQQDNRLVMLEKVCRPALKLLGAIEEPIATKGEFIEFFSYKDITKAALEGISIPKYHTPKVLPIQPGYITITLREVDYWPHRNSNLKEWVRFAEYLMAKGERVIFVRDTAKADEPFFHYTTCPEASKDLETRLALYQQAKCNCFVANGPVNLCFFSDCPFLDFMPMDDQGAYNAGRSIYWEQCAGIKAGEQFPWFKPNQRIIWKPDHYTNLVVAWEETFGDWKINELKVQDGKDSGRRTARRQKKRV